MNKPVSPKDSLIERAAEIFDFSSALHGKGLPPVHIDPADLPPEPPAQQPAQPQAMAASQSPAMPEQSVPVQSAAAPMRAADWTGALQPLDRKAMEEAGYLIPNAPVSGVGEEFRIIKREVVASIRGTRHQDAWTNANVVLVTSAHSGDGKTYCAINLAISLAAETDVEILLVDGDVARPGIVEALGLKGGKGFMDALVDPHARVEDYVIPTDVPNLFVLPAGATSNQDAEYLASARMERLIEALVAGRPNRIVIFDSPPLLAATPAAVLASHVGQTLLVVRADRTTEAALRDCANLLRNCAHVRLLLNGVKFSASGRRFGTYYGKEG